MKKFKKFFAVILSLAMVLGMSITSFAADGAPSSSDTAKITISGIAATETPTFKVYQIVAPDYEKGVGLTGYHVVSGYTIADKTNFIPADDEVAGLVTVAGTKTAESFTFVKDATGNYVADGVGAGEYLVIAESAGYTYNPMVVSVAYSNANSAASLANGSVNAGSEWDINGSDAFVKSSPIKPEKKVDVNTQEVGGSVNYEITGTIPSYGPNYTNPVYKITDTYTNLTDVSVPQVFIGKDKTTPVTEGSDTYSYEATKNGFVITFNNIGKRAAASKEDRDVLIKYTAKIAESAKVSNPATNSATLNYTHTPGKNEDADPVNTYTYTFDIADQFVKTGENNAPLAESTFTLYKAGSTDAYKTCTTKVENGKAVISFAGLDLGTYTMKETVATDGYSINDTVYTIVIKDATYDSQANNKKLTGYTVEVTNDKDTKKATYTYTLGTDGNWTVDNTTATPVQNTKLSSLPSTGGIGTTIFTIGGCVIMIAAAALFFASRKRAAK